MTAVMPCRRFTVLRVADHDPAMLGLLAGARIGLHTVLTDVLLSIRSPTCCASTVPVIGASFRSTVINRCTVDPGDGANGGGRLTLRERKIRKRRQRCG